MKNAQLAVRMGTSVAVVAGCLSGAACSASTSALAPSSTPVPVSSSAAPASPSTPPTPSAEPTTATRAHRTAEVHAKVTQDHPQAACPYSWRPGCPVPLQDLRLITMSYWGFDDQARTPANWSCARPSPTTS